MASIAFPPAQPAWRPVHSGKTGGASVYAQLLPLLAVLYTTLLPGEVRIAFAGQTFYAYRIAMFCCVPWLVMRVVRREFPISGIDLLVFTATGWMTVSYVGYYGVARGLPSGIALTLDYLLGYLVARASIRSTRDLRHVLILFAPGLLFAGGLVMLEALTHVAIAHPLAGSIFGKFTAAELGVREGMLTNNDIRLGMKRGTGPFPHPIHAGIYLGTMLALYLSAGLKGWPRIFGTTGSLLAFFSLSSAGLLSLLLVFSAFSYDFIRKRTVFLNWPILLGGLALIYVLLDQVSQKGAISVLIRYTLDPQTGYFRQLIWQYGSQSVMHHPLFGIGTTPYERLPWMVPSVDNQWLALAIKHGLVTSVVLLIACIATIWKLGLRRARVSVADSTMLFGSVVAIFVLMLDGFTVSYYNLMPIMFMSVLGIGVSLSQFVGHVPVSAPHFEHARKTAPTRRMRPSFVR